MIESVWYLLGKKLLFAVYWIFLRTNDTIGLNYYIWPEEYFVGVWTLMYFRPNMVPILTRICVLRIYIFPYDMFPNMTRIMVLYIAYT